MKYDPDNYIFDFKHILNDKPVSYLQRCTKAELQGNPVRLWSFSLILPLIKSDRYSSVCTHPRSSEEAILGAHTYNTGTFQKYIKLGFVKYVCVCVNIIYRFANHVQPVYLLWPDLLADSPGLWGTFPWETCGFQGGHICTWHDEL